MTKLTLIDIEPEDEIYHGIIRLRCEACHSLYVLFVENGHVVRTDRFGSLGLLAGLTAECSDHEIPEGVPVESDLRLFEEAME